MDIHDIGRIVQHNTISRIQFKIPTNTSRLIFANAARFVLILRMFSFQVYVIKENDVLKYTYSLPPKVIRSQSESLLRLVARQVLNISMNHSMFVCLSIRSTYIIIRPII